MSAPWGVFVSTPEVSAKSATVVAKTDVQNDTNEDADVMVRTVLVGPSGIKAHAMESKVAVHAGQSAEISQQFTLDEPQLWSPSIPVLYHAKTQILQSGKLLDEVDTSFGVRSLAWSVEKGLLLNGLPSSLPEAAFITTMGRLAPQLSIALKSVRQSC